MSGHLSALRIDRFRLHELPRAEEEAVRAHLAECAPCASAAAAQSAPVELPPLRARDAAAPAARVVALPTARARKPLAWIAGAAALAAGVVLIARPWSGERVTAESTKGPAHALAVYVQHDGQVRAVARGEAVSAGDALRFSISSRSPAFVAVLSVDPRGEASIYFPLGERAAQVSAGSDVALPLATRLDETRGQEHLAALFCDSPVELAPVRDSLARGALLVPAGCEVSTWDFEKR